MVTAERVPTLVNGVNVDNLFTTVHAIKTAPSIAKFVFRIENRWEGGSRNRSGVSAFHGAGQEISRQTSFVLHADEPPVLLGEDSAANPVEYLLHSLAACLTTSMVYHAAARGIQIEAVESSFEGDIDLHGFLDLDPNIRNGYQGIRVRSKLRLMFPTNNCRKSCNWEPDTRLSLIRSPGACLFLSRQSDCKSSPAAIPATKTSSILRRFL